MTLLMPLNIYCHSFWFQTITLCDIIFLFYIFPTRCNVTHFINFWKTALHVSGGISTHHDEHTQLYLQYLVLVKPLLLPAAIVEE